MVLYHGSTKDRICGLLEKQKYNPEFDKDGWGGLWATTNIRQAEQYGECVVKIIIDDAYKSRLLGYPIFPEAMDTEEDWIYEAVEYLIPKEVPFRVEGI